MSWSRDSSRLDFSAIQHDRANLGEADAREAFDIFVVGVDGSGLKRITGNAYADYAPIWQP